MVWSNVTDAFCGAAALALGQGNANTVGLMRIINSNIANHLTQLYPTINSWNHVTLLGYNGQIQCTFGSFPMVSADVSGNTDWKTPNALIWYNDESPGSTTYVDNLRFGYK